MNAYHITVPLFSTPKMNSTDTNAMEPANTTYLIQPIFFRSCDAGMRNGSRSRIIAVQHAYPHHPRPNSSGPKIFATT